MFDQIDTPGLLAAVLPLTLAIITGVITLAWRLGKLEQTVHEQRDDMEESQRDRREMRTDLTNIRSDVAALRAQVRDVQNKVGK